MADENYPIVLVPRLPDTPYLGVVFRTDKGFAVRATEATLQSLKQQNISVVELFANTYEYLAAVSDRSAQEALAAIQDRQNQAIAALEPGDRDQFSVA